MLFLAVFLLVCCDGIMNSVSPLNSSSATVIEVILSEEDVALLVGDNYDIDATAYNENVKVENAALTGRLFGRCSHK